MATGSYEGSLSAEGTSGRHAPSSFTRGWSRRPWRLPHAGKQVRRKSQRFRRGREGTPMSTAQEEDATEVSEARSVRWRRGIKTPTLGELTHQKRCGRRANRGNMAARVQWRSAEAFASVVKHSVPQSSHGAQDSGRHPRGESRGVSWEHTRYGYTQIVQVADVGRTHRASCSPPTNAGRKACWRGRALVGRKLETPPDAGYERSGGETVRGRALTSKTVGVGSVCGFRLAKSRYDGRRSRALARLALTGAATRGPSARRSIFHAPHFGGAAQTAHRSAQRPVGRAFG